MTDDSHDKLAEIYDEWVVGLQDDTGAAVGFLAGLAAGCTGTPAFLELGVGSGRIALPLAAKGFDVTGVDASAPMLDLLRAKEGAERITLVEGDFAELAVDGRFDVAFVVYNTFYSLPSEQDQARCLHAVAARLRPGGVLVVQAFVPDVARFDRGASSGRDKELARAGASVLRMRVTQHDRERQYLETEYTLAGADGDREYRFHFRYLWPEELDKLAVDAGLSLENRWGGWENEPFTGTSTLAVSVFCKN